MAIFASLAVVKMQADISTSESHGRRARELAEKGVALASHPNVNNGDTLLRFQNEKYAEGYEASKTSLAQTFGINSLVGDLKTTLDSNEGTISSSLLYQLFTGAWGMNAGDAQTLLHSLVEWVDPDDQVTTISGWERLNYEREGFIGRPFNRFFKSLDELQYVNGFQALEEAQPNWRSYFNIWTTGEIDLTSASPEIISLASMTGFGRLIDEDSARELQESLLGADGIIGTPDDMPEPDLSALLSEASSGDGSQIQERYTIEGENPRYAVISSKGWSGATALTINLSLQFQSARPQILERTETLENLTHEEK